VTGKITGLRSLCVRRLRSPLNQRERKRERREPGCGQAATEFALLSPLILFILLVGFQLAIIGNEALAVTRLAYTGARYASVNPTLAQSAIQTYVRQVGAGQVNTANLQVTPFTQCTQPPASFGSQTTVGVTLDISSLIFMPQVKLPLFNLALPTSVSSTQTAFCE
jgi:TadE-like protein